MPFMQAFTHEQRVRTLTSLTCDTEHLRRWRAQHSRHVQRYSSRVSPLALCASVAESPLEYTQPYCAPCRLLYQISAYPGVAPKIPGQQSAHLCPVPIVSGASSFPFKHCLTFRYGDMSKHSMVEECEARTSALVSMDRGMNYQLRVPRWIGGQKSEKSVLWEKYL